VAPHATHFVWEVDGLPLYRRPPPRLENAKPFSKDEIEFKRGSSIAVPLPTARFVVDQHQERRDFLLNLPGWPVCSGKLREALARAGVTNVQYFPVRLVTKSGKAVRSDDSVMNVVGTVKCLDWSRSKFADGSRAEGFAIRFEKLALVASKLRQVKLARLGENPGVLIVSLEVRRVLEDAQVSGIRFTAPSEYRG
jgi:hypothetical protein